RLAIILLLSVATNLSATVVLLIYALIAWALAIWQVRPYLSERLHITSQHVRHLLRTSCRFAWPLLIWGPFTYLQLSASLWVLQESANSQTVSAWAVAQ